MIQLTFINKPKSERELIVNTFCTELYNSCQKNKLKELNDWCDEWLPLDDFFDTEKKDFIPYLEVMKADLKTLEKIKTYLNKNSVNMESKPKLKSYLTETLYKKINHNQFISIINVTVCPYCNRNFINSNQSDSTCQFDHFYNKNHYPLFSASFYNLIPVCPSCNRIKHCSDFSYSPYDSSIHPDDMYFFSYHPIGVDYMKNGKNLKIVIKEIPDKPPYSKIHNNIKRLNLEDLYQLHTDIVVELLQKKQIYTPSYVSFIKKELKLSDHETERLITNAYTTPDTYGERPLSKLITDISKEIGLIKGD